VALKYGGYAIGLWVFFVFGFGVLIRSPLATWMGRISYSLYLQHLAIIYGLLWLTVTFGWAGQIGVWGWLVLSLGLTIGVATVSYKVVEAPSIALSDRLTRELRRKRGGIPLAARHEGP
jgi:peptidoglycan/LPS O-acetylase OafA/YrhL